jgi:hypothetical protein
MPRARRNARDRKTVDYLEMPEPPSDGLLFAQMIFGNPVRVFRTRPRELTDGERFTEAITGRPVNASHEPKFVVVNESYLFAQKILGKQLDKSLRPATEVTAGQFLSEAGWNPADHPRGGFPQNRGWFSATAGGSGSSGRSAPDSGTAQTGDYRAERRKRAPDDWRSSLGKFLPRGAIPSDPKDFSPPDRAATLIAAAPGAAAPTRPAVGPLSPALPNIGGAAAAAGAAAGIAAGGLLGGLANASMGAYWQREPAVQAMPKIWAYELKKRVDDGTLSREDANGILATAIAGADAQGFAPTGNTISAIQNSAADFLKSAEAVYFARKKKAAEAKGTADAEQAAPKPERVTGEELAKRRREFEGMKSQLWKDEAVKNPEKYSHEQLGRMRSGKAPDGPDGKRMEIHHKKPLSDGGTNTHDNFEFTTQTEHRLGPNLKKNHPNLPRGPRQ